MKESLPDEREALTHKCTIHGTRDGAAAETDIYITVGFYDDGRIGEIWLTLSDKTGGTVRALVDAVSTAVSIGLQHGAPLEAYIEKFARTRFAPAGPTDNPDIRRATSILDYVFRWLAGRFPGGRSDMVQQSSMEILGCGCVDECSGHTEGNC